MAKTDPTIRAALEAAAMTQCCDNWDEMDPSDHAVAISFTAPAIAAFLRALPTGSGRGLFEFGDDDRAQCLFLAEAAAAVEAAAKGDEG